MEPTITERMDADRRAVLSSLWIFVLLNMLFRDIHEFARTGFIEELMSMNVSEGTLLAAGIGLTLFISMVVFSRVLPRRLNRRANLVVPVLALAGMLANAPRDLDDIWFMAVEILGLLVILRLAWTWHDEGSSESAAEEVATSLA